MTTTIKFKALDLRRVLANASLFAAPEKDCLPALSVVRFDWEENHLLAVATNRYVLSWEEVVPAEADGQESFSIPTRDVKRILALLPKTDRNAEAQLQYDPETGRIEVVYLGDVIRFKAGGGQFMQWRTLRDRFDGAEQKTVTLGAGWLGLLAKVDGGYKGASVHFEMAEDCKPVRVSIGETFRALIVPIKNAG